LQVQEEFRFVTAKPSRVGIAASSLFDPAESADPQQACSVQVLALIGTLMDFQLQPTSAM
jgi:hypothetical protein